MACAARAGMMLALRLTNITEVLRLKKVLAAVTVVIVLSMAGSAMAYGGRHHGRGPGYGQGPRWEQGGGYGYQGNGHHWQKGPGHRGAWDGPGRGNWNGEVPQNIRDKMVAAEKLMVDLRAEMTRPQVDKAKALELWKQHRAVRGEIAEWFFTQRLEWAANRPAPTQP